MVLPHRFVVGAGLAPARLAVAPTGDRKGTPLPHATSNSQGTVRK